MRKGLALVIILLVGMIGIGGLAWLVAMTPADIPKTPPKFNPEDMNAIIARVGMRSISRFHLNLSKELERVRVKKEDLMPDYGFLIRLMEAAAEEEIAAKFGAKIVEADLQREIARVDKETKEPESLQKIKEICKPYPGMYEFLIIRTGYLANQMIHNLHKFDRGIQSVPFKKYTEIFKKAQEDQSSLTRFKDEAGVVYEKVDSRKLPGDVRVEMDMGRHKEQVMEFAKKNLSKTPPGAVCPDQIDDDWSYRVVRLEERNDDFVVYELLSVTKIRFEVWYAEQLKGLDIEVPDAKLMGDLAEKAAGNLVINALLAKKPK